ncbi:MAG: hypothetical protein QOI29_234 [Mycobacterium sp.]|nr:hypothetical protein [Mycobacterium sp.]
MSTPGWLRWTLAAAMIAVVCYHLARLASARLRQRPIHHDVELGHAGMGVVMAAMLVGSLSVSLSRGLALVFVVSMLWFASRSIRRYVLVGPRGVAPLLGPALGCAAMVYMLAVLAGVGGSSATAGTSMAGIPEMSIPEMSMPGMSMPGMSMDGMSAHGHSSPLTLLASPVMAGALVLGTVALAAWTVSRRPLRAQFGGNSAASALGIGCGLAVNFTTVYMLVVM